MKKFTSCLVSSILVSMIGLYGLAFAADVDCENPELSVAEKQVCETQRIKKILGEDSAAYERYSLSAKDGSEQIGSQRILLASEPVEESNQRALHINESNPQQDLNNTKAASKDVLGYVLMIWGFIVLLGVILGWNERIVVYRNYNDLAIVFASGVSTYCAFLVGFSFASTSNSMAMLSVSLVVVSISLIIYLTVRTFLDNRSLLWTLVALVTKITLSILFLFNLLSLLSPSGKTQRERSRDRSSALFWLVVITPVVYRLVRQPVGVFCPKDVFNKYQRGRTGVY